jgi:hypothetical protein
MDPIRVRRGSESSASACCMAGPSSNLGSAPQRRPSAERNEEIKSGICSVNIRMAACRQTFFNY